jgi:hypothetical protein
MSKKNDGGAAFPLPHTSNTLRHDGMSLRDYFAGQALTGMLTLTSAVQHPDMAAVWAYEQADAMLAERDKRSDEQ